MRHSSKSGLVLGLLLACGSLQAEQSHEMLPAGTTVMKPATPANQFDAQAFQNRYQQAGSPRVVLYLNRELSDRVDEWDSSERVVTSFEGVAMGRRQTEPTDGNISLSVQTRQATNTTHEYPEDTSWRWAFEQTMQSTLLEQGVTLVDRKLMLRQTALQQPENKTNELTSTKRLEAEALQAKADILVEVVVLKGAEAGSYQLKATAYNVKQSTVIAALTTAYRLGTDGEIILLPGRAANSNRIDVTSRTYVATKSGYEVRTDNSITAATLARTFAEELMSAMAPRL